MRTTSNLGLSVPETTDLILGSITAYGNDLDIIDSLVWRGTQAQYDALETKQNYITYLIEEAS